MELEASVRCTGEAADETLTVRLTALDGAPMPEGCEDEAELDFPARDCRDADDKTLTKTFDAIVYTAPGIYEYTVTQDAGGRKRLHLLVEKRFRGELNKCQGCAICK